MTNEELKKKIVGILNKNFTEEWVVTPVYTTNDGKEIELPQELCEIFNDIVVQAVIPYFADALIAAGIGDIQDIRGKANLDISGATSNPTQYTEAPADPQEPKIKKWYRNTVGHEPANYDAAALKAYIAHLEAENAALHERLSKAVELPCKVGETVYEIIDGEIRETEVIQLEIDNMGLWITIRMGFGVSTVLFNKIARIYLTREAAEARLKELQGEKK